MAKQTILLTSHKGVDLHAATAVRVMRERLSGGRALLGLYRCECHTFWADDQAPRIEQVLATGRYFNPNKHHYGHFEVEGGEAWFARDDCRGAALPEGWPGTIAGSDLVPPPPDLYDSLLGGAAPADCRAVDVVAFAFGQSGPLLSGVLWRLVLSDSEGEFESLAESLIVARSSGAGLLVNPHMEGWLTSRQRETV